jgi:DNA-directed RNA polymerase specialized sigma subunit
MEFVPSRSQAHLIVASIRILTHQTKRPPTPDEIAEQIDFAREHVLHILRGLEARKIVRTIENPFDVRIDIADYRAIEELPEEATGPDMGREIEDFHKKAEDRQRKIEQMMRESDPESSTRKKAKQIEKEFQRFRSQKGRSPFKK